MENVAISLISALLGFIGGLIAPWIRWEVEKRRKTREERASLIVEWRNAIDTFNFDNDSPGDTAWYSSLRGHMRQEIIKKVEAPRTLYVGGGRGENIIKHMLLDEVTRLEKELWDV